MKNGEMDICSNNETIQDFEEKLNCFEFLKDYDELDLLNIFRFKNSVRNEHLLHIKTTTRHHYKGRSSSNSENYIICYFEIKESLGHVMIRPETFEDKINEFFSKAEIDFDSNPKFSNKYYMLSNNEVQTETNISTNFLSIIEEYDNLHIEINNNKSITTSLITMNIEEAERMADFCRKASVVA